VENILRGATVKITYLRKNFEQTKAEGVDYNGDLERSKVFTQFGARANDQKFFKVLQKKRSDPNRERELDPKHTNGRTVLDFFQKGESNTLARARFANY
jgi:hypothetical protein